MTRLFRKVQQRLVTLYGQEHYYTQKYSGEEGGYIGSIPVWLYYLRVNNVGGLGDVLDIGPGYGTLACYSSKLGANSVTTLDRVPFISQAVIDEYKLIALEGDVERNCPTLAPNTYDTVIITEVLEHLNFHPLLTLMKIEESMRVNGTLYLSTPDQTSWGKLTKHYSRLIDIPVYNRHHALDEWKDEHIWHYSYEEVLQLLAAANLKIKAIRYSASPGGRHFNIEAVK